MFDFFKSPLKKKWLHVEIGISADKDLAGILKRKLYLYADDLGWEILTERDSEEENRMNILIVPPERGDTRALSPLEFKELKRKLFIFAQEIAKELGVKKITHGFHIERTKFEEGNIEPIYSLIHWDGFLQIQYNIKDRIKFEAKYKELSKELFGDSLDEFIEELEKDKKIMKDKFAEGWIREVKEILEKSKSHE